MDGDHAVTRPRIFDLPGAAQRMGVSERTIRSWVDRGHLRAIPLRGEDGRTRYYAEPALVQAERLNRAGRTRRQASVAS